MEDYVMLKKGSGELFKGIVDRDSIMQGVGEDKSGDSHTERLQFN
jgi:hypothetical protein